MHKYNQHIYIFLKILQTNIYYYYFFIYFIDRLKLTPFKEKFMEKQIDGTLLHLLVYDENFSFKSVFLMDAVDERKLKHCVKNNRLPNTSPIIWNKQKISYNIILKQCINMNVCFLSTRVRLFEIKTIYWCIQIHVCTNSY